MIETDEIRRKNLEIAAKFSKIEEQLPKAKSIAGLFEILFTGIENEFAVPFVWLTLVDNEAAAPVTAAIKSSEKLKNRLNVISSALFQQILPAGIKPILANKELQPYYKLLPLSNKYFVKSLAIVPFKIGEEIIGSWNNGDVSSERYIPEMETDLLQKLAQKVSLRMTEIVSAGR
jgi:uncharacterized protein YigA (DUF484 family)